MKQAATVVVIEIVVLTILVIAIMSVFLGSRDEWLVRRNFYQALDYYYSEHWEEAQAKLQFCMDTKPEYAPPYQVAGALYLRRGDYESAEMVYAASVENCGDSALPLSDLGTSVAAAVRAAEENDTELLKEYADAIESMREAVEYPSDALINTGAAKVTAGDFEGGWQALAALEGKEGTVAMEAVPVWYNTRAILEFQNGRKDEAMKLLRKAAKITVEWETPIANLSAMSVATITDDSTVKEVLVKLVKELERTDTSAFLEEQAYAYHNTLGAVAYLRLGSGYNNLAVEQIDKAITIMPRRAEAKINKALIMTLECDNGIGRRHYTRSQMLSESERLCSEALNVVGDDKDTAYYAHVAKGILLTAQEKMKEAGDEFKRAIELLPEDYLAHRGLGMVCLKQEIYDVARKHLEKSNEYKNDQEDVKKALQVLQASPRIENASVRYTKEPRPVVGIRASVHSCPRTLENSRIEVAFDGKPAFFKVRPLYITCMPVSALDEGEHKISLSLTDPAGNAVAKTFDLSVDKTPPVIEAVRPAENGQVKAPWPELRVRISDKLSEIDLSTLVVKYMTGPGMDTMVSQEVVKFGRYTYNIPDKGIEKDALFSGEVLKFTPKSKLRPGSYRIQVEAQDVLENKTLQRYDFQVVE